MLRFVNVLYGCDDTIARPGGVIPSVCVCVRKCVCVSACACARARVSV